MSKSTSTTQTSDLSTISMKFAAGSAFATIVISDGPNHAGQDHIDCGAASIIGISLTSSTNLPASSGSDKIINIHAGFMESSGTVNHLKLREAGDGAPIAIDVTSGSGTYRLENAIDGSFGLYKFENAGGAPTGNNEVTIEVTTRGLK